MLSELFYPFMSGGAERRYFEIAKRLSKKHNVTVYALNLEGSQTQEIINGIEIIRVGSKHPIGERKLAPLATFWPAIIRAVTGNYDIIDANQGIASFSGIFNSLVKKPVVATFHDIYWNQWNTYFKFPASTIGKTMEFVWSKTRYSNIFTVSPTTEQKLISLGFRGKIDVIPSGVDTDMINKIKVSREPKKFVYVGRLVKYKNVDLIIRAFEKIKKTNPDAQLHIIGTGPEEMTLVHLSKELGVHVKFHGFVEEEKKMKIIKSASALINPSDVEGLGLILIEAMACGTPVIAKNLPTYFFCNKRNSILFNRNDQLSEAMERVIVDSGYARDISKNSIKTAQEFSWNNTAKKVETVYRRYV
jgi:L-malate glycosyltransferase